MLSTPKHLKLNCGQLTTHADSRVFFFLSKGSFHYCACKLGLIDMILAKFFFSFQGIKTSLETLLLLNIAIFLERGMPAYNFSLQDN